MLQMTEAGPSGNGLALPPQPYTLEKIEFWVLEGGHWGMGSPNAPSRPP